MKHQADAGDWQARGQLFAVGQSVRLTNGGDTDEGRVVAVWPAIGMVDVQFPHTSYRIPVEDLQILDPKNDKYITPMHETVPGGAGSSAQVSMGKPRMPDIVSIPVMASRVARAYVKKALYWNGRDRKYRCTRTEGETGEFTCPKSDCSGVLKPAIYKRVDGASVKLLGCPKCMFLIRRQDVIESDCVGEGERI